MRDRTCYNCERPLSFDGYLGQNLEYSAKLFDELIKIWESKHIELYCCRCYTQEKLRQKYKFIEI